MHTALIADEDPSVLKVLNCFLRTLGWSARCAGDHKTAFRNFLTSNPNLLICDVHLGGWYGIEMAQRCLKLKRGLRVVMISEYREGIILAQEEGFRHCFRRPFDLTALRSVIEQPLLVELPMNTEAGVPAMLKY